MIDTLKVARRLREAGFTDPQAEAVIATVQEAAEGAEFATRGDLDRSSAELKAAIAELRTELKADIAELRTELRTEVAELKAENAVLRSALRETELRLEARIEAVKSEILNRVFGLILGALVVNIIAMVGAVFAVAKLVVH
jgi:DNA-binding transcriptional MerR regulator